MFLFKHRNLKINEELQKVKTKELLHDWKEDYRSTQQQLRRKRLVKGKGNLKKKNLFYCFFLFKKITQKQLFKLHLELILIIFV